VCAGVTSAVGEECAARFVAGGLAVQSRRLEQVEVRRQRLADGCQRHAEFLDAFFMQPEQVAADSLEDLHGPERQLGVRLLTAAASGLDVHDHRVLAEVRGKRRSSPEPAQPLRGVHVEDEQAAVRQVLAHPVEHGVPVSQPRQVVQRVEDADHHVEPGPERERGHVGLEQPRRWDGLGCDREHLGRPVQACHL
jgi:hypothetical protein